MIAIDNCLLFDGGKPPHYLLLKLSDFGMSEESNLISQRVVGTRSYMAPEILKNKYQQMIQQKYKCKTFRLDMADWWAVGVTFYKILNGHFPLGRMRSDSELRSVLQTIFETNGQVETNSLVYQTRVRQYLTYKPCISTLTKAILNQMLEPLPHKRMANFELLFQLWNEDMTVKTKETN